MIKSLIARSKDERGFTLVELMSYIAILSIFLGVAAFGYANMLHTSYLNNSANQVKEALQRGYTMAMNENQRVTIRFYGPGNGDFSNTYTFVRADGTKEEPLAGVASVEVGGNYYEKLLEGQPGLAFSGDLNISFHPDGTVLTIEQVSYEVVGGVEVTTATTPETIDVVISYGGETRTVTINSKGEVSR